MGTRRVPNPKGSSPLLGGTSIKNFGPLDPAKARAGRGVSATNIEVQGLNTLIDHWFASAEMVRQLTPQVVDFYSDIVVHNARQFVRKDTWATHDSINKDPGVQQAGLGHYFADMGPTTFYARFLEFGTIKMPAYPFMIPAIDSVEKDYIAAFVQIAKIPDQMANTVKLTGPFARSPAEIGRAHV